MTTTTTLSLRASKPPITPLPFNRNQPPTLRLYPLSNYTFGTKEQQPEEDPSVQARLKRLEEHYEKHGMRRTCEGILVCHEHNHPHVLMLQIANAFYKLCVSITLLKASRRAGIGFTILSLPFPILLGSSQGSDRLD